MKALYRLIPIDELKESGRNLRRGLDPTKLADLTASVRASGVLTPLLVRPIQSSSPASDSQAGPKVKGCALEVAAGHRRLRAAKAAGLSEVPCIVREMSDAEFLEVLTIENLQREDVHPLDEAEGYRALLDLPRDQDGGGGHDVASIAAKVGKSASYVYQRLKLADLIESAKKAFAAEKLNAAQAVLIARLQPPEQADALKSWAVREGHGVRELARWIEENVHLDLHGAAFPKDDASLLPPAGACVSCPKRTGACPDLFPDIKKKDTCTDPACFGAKIEAHIARQLETLAHPKKPVNLTERSYYYDPRGGKGEKVLTSEAWAKAKKPDECGHIRPGVLIEGSGRGRVLLVCTDTACEVHFKRARDGQGRAGARSSASADEKERRRRAALETAAREKIFGAVRLQDLGVLAGRNRDERMRLVLRGVLQQMDSLSRGAAFKALCWEDDFKSYCAAPEDERKKRDPEDDTWYTSPSESFLRSAVTRIDGPALDAILLVFAVAPELRVHPYDPYDEGRPAVLEGLAALCGVDTAAIRRDIETKAREKAAAKAARKSAPRREKAKAGAGGRTAGGARRKTKAAPAEGKKKNGGRRKSKPGKCETSA